MPATYQIVPYVINVRVRGNATELRPLWDLDARGATMQSAIRGIASAARGRNFVDPSDDRRRLQVKSVKCGAGTVFVEWEPGRAGIESNIHREDGSSVPRRAADTEYIPVRHLFFLPPGGYNGFLLAERVGVHGAVTMAATLLRASFNARHDTLRLVVLPAMTAEVLRRQIDQQPVKALVFKRFRKDDPTGRNMLVAGQSVSVEIRMRPGRNKFWRRDQLFDNEGTLLGVLNPVLQADVQSGPSIEQLIGDGWEASCEVIMPNRTTRLVSVAQTRSTTMSFPILPPDKDEGLRRPSDDEFREGCAFVISDFAGGHGPAAESASNCRWEAAEWALGPDDEPWWFGMTGTAPHQLLLDQFTQVDPYQGSTRKLRLFQLLLLLPALVVATVATISGVRTIALAPLLTATSILTGLTFTMALRFWERSVDARRDPFIATDGPRLTLLDDLRAHLTWTVLIGVIGTGWLVIMALFNTVTPPSWFAWLPSFGVVGASFLVAYQLTLVAGALRVFYAAAYGLRG